MLAVFAVSLKGSSAVRAPTDENIGLALGS